MRAIGPATSALLLLACATRGAPSPATSAVDPTSASSTVPSTLPSLPTAPPGSLTCPARDAAGELHAPCARVPSSVAKHGASGDGPVGFWEERLAKYTSVLVDGRSLRVHAIVLAGEADATRGIDGLGETAMGPWRGVAIDDATLKVHATVDGTRVLFAVIGLRSTTGVERALRPIDFTTATPLRWGDGAFEARLAIEATSDPVPPASLALLRIGAGGRVAPHDHARAWEALYVVDAAGTFAQGDASARLEGAGVVEVAPGTRHAWASDPERGLVAVQLYAGPGPEQRFKALAAPSGATEP